MPKRLLSSMIESIGTMLGHIRQTGGKRMGNIRYKIVLVDDSITTLAMGRNMLKTFFKTL